MTNLTINNKNRTIEMTKKFAKAVSRYGTEEYNALQAARKDYPTYQVVTKSSNSGKSKESHRGLTYDYMEKYIAKHDDEKKSIMTEFNMLRATSDEAKEVLAEACSYQEMKAWFFEKFPAIKEFHEKREKILAA